MHLHAAPHTALNRLTLGALVFAVMDGRSLDELRAKLAELNEDAKTIQRTADAENRAMTADEERQWDAIMNEFDTVKLDVERRERMESNNEAISRPRGRQVPPANPQDTTNGPGTGTTIRPAPAGGGRVEVIDRLPRGQWGWNSLGEMALAVRAAANPGGPHVDERLRRGGATNAPTTYGSDGVGADGGFAVPPDFRTAIMEKVMAENTLLSRVDQIPINGNSFSMPVDETTPWQTSGGVQAYWEDEAGQHTQNKAALKTVQLRANKITALVGITEENLEDAPAMDAYLRKKAPEKINYKVDAAIINGNGVGKPLGILNSPCLVTVSKEGSQASDTFLIQNIAKMYSRMYAPCISRSVWLLNQDVMPQLLLLNSQSLDVDGSTAFGGVPMYLPPGQIQQAPQGMLLGRPIVYTEACPTLGDKGDAIFADLTQYLAIVKGGLKSDVSMHLWFDYSVVAYKFSLRIGGMPWWASAITPASGSNNTLGCFVVCESR